MTNKIDTDLIAAYTREVQRVCEKANEQIETLNAAIERLTKDKEFYIIQCQELDKKLAIATTSNTRQAEWHPATETPDGDQRAIVRTEEGATFMYEPINGKWPKWVVKWMYIPQ